MRKMQIFLPLLCVLCATSAQSIFDGTCLRKGKPRIKFNLSCHVSAFSKHIAVMVLNDKLAFFILKANVMFFCLLGGCWSLSSTRVIRIFSLFLMTGGKINLSEQIKLRCLHFEHSATGSLPRSLFRSNI